MGKDSAPPPDYRAQAEAQGQENRNTAQYNNNANRANQITPYGSSTWTLRDGADPKNPQPGDYIQTTTLAPGQQRLLDTNTQTQQQLLEGSQAGVSRALDALGRPLDTSGVPALRGAPGVVQTAQAGQGITGQAPAAGDVTTSVNRTGLPTLNNDFTAQRDQVTQALLSRINPDLARARSTREADLANRGIDLGSTAYGSAQDILGRNENDQRMGAVLAGGQEQSRLQGLALANRSQMSGEATNDANFANSAQGQRYNQGLASAQFGNQAQAQGFGQSSSQDAVINALLGRNAVFDNNARSQGLSEAISLRQQPLNEVNALRSGNQVTAPTFSNYYSSGAAPAPVFDAATAAGGAAQNSANQSNASTNATMGAIVSAIAIAV